VCSLYDPALPRVPQQSLSTAGFRAPSPDRDLVERIEARGTPLRDLCYVSLGMVFHDPRPGGKRKADYIRAVRQGRFKCPLLDGEHVGRWRALGRVWLDYRPDEHREPRSMACFTSEKVLCRRIIGKSRLMAMVDDEGRWFSDNVVGAIPYYALLEGEAGANVVSQCTAERVRNSREISMDFLVGVLNSRLMNWYYQQVHGFGLHMYPAHLKAMPIALGSPRAMARLAALAREARALDNATLETAIDQEVEKLYGLDARDRARIGNYYHEP
jgi:hypothetical protein